MCQPFVQLLYGLVPSLLHVCRLALRDMFFSFFWLLAAWAFVFLLEIPSFHVLSVWEKPSRSLRYPSLLCLWQSSDGSSCHLEVYHCQFAFFIPLFLFPMFFDRYGVDVRSYFGAHIPNLSASLNIADPWFVLYLVLLWSFCVSVDCGFGYRVHFDIHPCCSCQRCWGAGILMSSYVFEGQSQ